MKLYLDANNDVIAAVFDADVFRVNNPITNTFQVDEVDPDNREICHQLSTWVGKTDINNVPRYYVQGGELYERDGWKQKPTPV